MSRSLAKLLFFVFLIAGIVLVCIFSTQQLKIAAYLAAFATLIATYVCQYFLRCPHCGKWPDRTFLFDEYCSRCGKPLDNE